MTNYILVDSLNVFFRAKHVARGNIDMKVGMAMHIIFNSIKKAWNDFDGGHVVFCLEGNSWRKVYYDKYKANRKVAQLKRTVREQEDDELFFEAFNEFIEFIKHKSNCTVLQEANSEADDLIAMWIQSHPDDNHTIISNDSDFYQLINENVSQYNGTAEKVITHNGIFDGKTGKPVINKKTKEVEPAPEPEWLLFEKCVRGDTSDNIFSAYPGARIKGSKNKTGMREAFDDRHRGGYNYNNFMLQRWLDENGDEHVVRDDFLRNKQLIDLTQQPEEIKEACLAVIGDARNKDKVQGVGPHFLKFCGLWDLNRISKSPHDYTDFLNAHISRVQEECQTSTQHGMDNQPPEQLQLLQTH